jgi:glycosyltransferase involved in cell wall biosynthesis
VLVDNFYKLPAHEVAVKNGKDLLKMNMFSEKKYVLITPARNEEACIERIIKSVISQTVLPKKWVIVNDGSSDGTTEIVSRYAAKYDFIDLISVSRSGERNFGAKALAFKYGYEHLRETDFDFVGNLDADVSFDAAYFEEILARFQKNPRLGIAGGIILEYDGNKFWEQNTSLNSVSGAVQMFRRQCYEESGGYKPLKLGGIDAFVETMARKHGWTVQTFPELKVMHHRRVGVIAGKIFQARFRHGMMNYTLGYHPLFQFIRCLLRMKDKPYFVGSMLMLCGYCWASIRRYEKAIPAEFMNYLRSEQTARLWSLVPVGKKT